MSENIIQKAEAAIEHAASEIKSEVVHVGHEISTEFHKVVAAVEGEAKKIEVDVTPVAAATVAGNTAATLAPKTAVEVPSAVIATPVARVVKNIPAPQTVGANGKSRYAADGLTIDWFATHPRK